MENLKLIAPYPMFGPGAENFPASDESPDGMQSVEWHDRQGGVMIDVKPNIVYQSLSGEDQHIQLFTPMSLFAMPGAPAPKYPLLVYVPGSAWHRQNVWMGLDKAQYFAAHGFAFAIVEYRPTEIGGTFPAQRDDAIAAIEFLKAHAAEYGIDADNVAVWGDSSGGHTSVWVGIHAPQLVKCVVDWFGPSDIDKMNYYPSGMDHHGADSPEGFLLGKVNVLENPELAQVANPINAISADKPVPPMLIMHGDKDNVVPFNQSVRLYDALKANGKDATLYKLLGGGHGSGGFVSDDALALVSEFVGKYLK
ncbi:MAG: prolyl oligopeptidase family serine peptidase [Oscillospiraceae bacterium]|jgi:acetyl esterase/lipase|nr:prolyl oligopeptidase family serine peptidase [Oscillospiraceae bacterium]